MHKMWMERLSGLRFPTGDARFSIAVRVAGGFRYKIEGAQG